MRLSFSKQRYLIKSMWPRSDKKRKGEETKTEIKKIVLSFGFALGRQLTDLVW